MFIYSIYKTFKLLNDYVSVVAVACGPDLLIYKNNKPYFKFIVPPLPIEALEHSVWNKLSEDTKLDLKSVLDDLGSIPYKSLSSRYREKVINIVL